MSALGFDTSNYTTSVAIYSKDNCVQSRKLLNVKPGERGLRQSDALFQHVKQLPEVIDKLGDIKNITSVGVSTRPRSVDGSYMPVFLAGLSFAETAAAVLGVPLYKFSHQDGHIMSGIISADAEELLEDKFLTVHISGGTTEIIETEYNGYGFHTKIVGGTKDISAGQVIDRIGVSLGFNFPCGKDLDTLSVTSLSPIKLPVSHTEGYFNFSGLETKASGLLNAPAEDIIAGVFLSISKTLVEAINYLIDKSGCCRVLIVGGVASSRYIREYLNKHINKKIYFASPELSSDNACGIAALSEYNFVKGE